MLEQQFLEQVITHLSRSTVVRTIVFRTKTVRTIVFRTKSVRTKLAQPLN